MRKFYATEDSAIQLIRLGLFPRSYEDLLFAPPDILDAACSIKDIKPLAAESDAIKRLSMPYTVLVPGHSSRRRSQLLQCRTLPAALRSSYLVSIDEHCLCVSPELLFTLYCQRHDLLPSIELGMELCGTYTKAAYDTRESFSRYDLPRLTSAQSLEMFLHDNRRIYGVNRAHEALAFVRDKSASPMETALVLLLCLPVSEGGYGLPLPELNADLPVTVYLGSKHEEDVRYGDLVYREHRIVLEYQSSEFHELTGTDEEDEDRRDDIEAAGYRVMFITPSRIRDFDRFEAVALRLAHHLGVTLPDATLGRTEKRIELRRALLPKSWLHTA